MHLFVDISSHGFGHLALSGPVLEALATLCPELRLTVRSGLSAARLAQRIRVPFQHLPQASDFGFVMQDATCIDLAASAAAYRAAHVDWPQRVADEAQLLSALEVDAVFSNISPLPLAGAQALGLPNVALCSLHWADLFGHFFGLAGWAAEIHAQLQAAYAGCSLFLRPDPAMPMPGIPRQQSIGPIARLGQRQRLDIPPGRRVLVAMGGIAHRLPVAHWPVHHDLWWLVPAEWSCDHPRAVAWESFGLAFTDLLCSVDAVLTKPGYGTFTEAACNGVPVLYQRRADWPEQEALIPWLQAHGVAREVSAAALHTGGFEDSLRDLLASPRPMPSAPLGGVQAAQQLLEACLPGAQQQGSAGQ